MRCARKHYTALDSREAAALALLPAMLRYRVRLENGLTYDLALAAGATFAELQREVARTCGVAIERQERS